MRLDWAGLDCIELGWAGTDWAEVGWGGLHGGRMLCQWVPISRGAPRILDTSRSCGLPGTAPQTVQAQSTKGSHDSSTSGCEEGP